MAVSDKKYISAIKAGVIGVVLIVIVAIFAYYMYERDQYNYWHSDAPMHYDNLCVGVFWIPFFLIALAMVAVFTGGLSVRMAGSAITSSRDAVLASAFAGIVVGGINIVLLTAGIIWDVLNSVDINSVDNPSIGDPFVLMNLAMSALWLLGYLVVQTLLSAMGGIIQWLRRSKT
jgi:hypothetical protein